jgi:hypothetical protein
MKYIVRLLLPLLFVLQISVIQSCKSDLPQEERKGKWVAASEFGSFGFIIDPTGSMITYFQDSLKCKSGSHSNKYTFNGGPGSDLTKEGEISLVLFAFANLPAVEVEGKFYKDGSGNVFASGKLWMFGRNNCATSWRAQKIK